MELKFVAAQKPKTQNPTVQRRQRLLSRIDQQLALLDGATVGSIPNKSWLWMDDAGNYFVSIKYGRQALELKKGMFAIQCTDLNHAVEAIGHIKLMAQKGELDPQLASASAEIRKKFKPD